MKTPTASEPFPEPVVYQPVSGLAVASLVVAGLYAVGVGILGAVALYNGTPLILGTWILVFPLIGLGLAQAARRQIRQSEGTRTGLSLANSGWWLSVLFGVGYAAISLGTYLAVRLQAESFTNTWLQKIRDHKITEAFLLTRTPAERKGENPNDSQRLTIRYGITREGGINAPLPQFRENEFIRFLEQGGPTTKIESLGVRNWEFTEGGYEVEQDYRLTTPEGTYDVLVCLRGTQTPEIQGRQWQVLWESRSKVIKTTLSPFGQAVEAWRQQAKDFTTQWVNDRNLGHFDAVYLATLVPEERTPWKAQCAAQLLAAGWVSAAVPPPLRGAFLAPWSDFSRAGATFLLARPVVMNFQKFDAPGRLQKEIPNTIRNQFLDIVHLEMSFAPLAGLPVTGTNNSDATQGPLHILQKIELMGLEMSGDKMAPRFKCQGTLMLQSAPGPITESRQPGWTVAQLELLSGSLPPAK